jgi:hypothetical protein
MFNYVSYFFNYLTHKFLYICTTSYSKRKTTHNYINIESRLDYENINGTRKKLWNRRMSSVSLLVKHYMSRMIV